MTSAPITNVVSNKYIIIFQGTHAIHINNYNYNKIIQKNNFII